MSRKRSFTMAFVIGCATLWACGGDESTQPLAPSSSASQAVAPKTSAATQNKDVVSDLLGVLGIGSKPVLFDCQGNGGPYTGKATVGILGGTVKFGPHSLVVPPLATFKPITITAQTVPGDTIAVQFQPAGTKFLLPPTLSLDYSHCQNRPANGPLTIDLLDDLLGTILDLLPSLDQGSGKVTAPIWHFSVYAAAESRGGRGH
jgi:hypothetical protein